MKDFTTLELKTLELICRGLSNSQMAEVRNVATATIEACKVRLHSKIKEQLRVEYGVERLASLNTGIVINWAMQNGLYTPPNKEQYAIMLGGHLPLPSDLRESNRAVRKVLSERKRLEAPFSVKVGYVYLMYSKATKLTKIGYSAAPKERLAALKNASGDRSLKLIAYNRGTVDDEHWLHIKYRRSRVSGEWFSFAEEEARKVREYLSEYLGKNSYCA